ncbi:hypothetical protein HY024_01770 [Candidatus Curtissbacteria bacterium]|nr:hypothetical protein [Candidatus Curtissbacteria bacterium]
MTGLASNEVLLNTLFFVGIIWTFVWKGMALWYSAKNNQKIWFIALLLVNTLGLLEIIYLFYFSKRKLTLRKIYSDVKSLKPPLHR